MNTFKVAPTRIATASILKRVFLFRARPAERHRPRNLSADLLKDLGLESGPGTIDRSDLPQILIPGRLWQASVQLRPADTRRAVAPR